MFQDAFVNQAWVYQAQKLLEEPEQADHLQPLVREAINPYLILEVRREHLIADTLEQISKKKKVPLHQPASQSCYFCWCRPFLAYLHCSIMARHRISRNR